MNQSDYDRYNAQYDDCEKRNMIAWRKPQKVNYIAIGLTLTFLVIVAIVIAHPQTTALTLTMLKGM